MEVEVDLESEKGRARPGQDWPSPSSDAGPFPSERPPDGWWMLGRGRKKMTKCKPRVPALKKNWLSVNPEYQLRKKFG